MLNHSYLPKATAVIGSQSDGFGIDRNSVVRVETGRALCRNGACSGTAWCRYHCVRC